MCESDRRAHLWARGDDEALPHRHERFQHQLLDRLSLARRLVHTVQEHDQRAQLVRHVNCIALRALEFAVDPAEQRVLLAHVPCELLHRH